MTDLNNNKNPYFQAYRVLSLALKNKDLNQGFLNALSFAKYSFGVNDISLFIKDENGYYCNYFDVQTNKPGSITTLNALNTAKDIIENNKYYYLNIGTSDINNYLFIPIKANDSRYAISITNGDHGFNISDIDLNLFIDSIQIAIDKLDMFNNLNKCATIDALTGLGNRMAYENAIKKEPTNGLVYVLFDLFRLKNINDNYSHALGDEYIKESAGILKKYFPKYTSCEAHGRNAKYLTGFYVYRIGGDEFALISENESVENVKIKTVVAQEEIKNLDLSINEHLGIDFGLSVRNNHESFRDLYLCADQKLMENKSKRYKVLGLDRRKI